MSKTPKTYKELKDKNYVMDVKASTDPNEEYTLDIVGSSEAIDRDGDIIMANGWELDNYEKNPVFLWGHDHGGLPIGKALVVKVNKKLKRLEFKIKFAVDEYPFAATVYRLFKSGFLNATSVGFMIKEWEYDEDKGENGAFVFLKNELLELSAVTVPANPEALMLGVSKGLFNKEDQEHMKSMGMLKRIDKEVDEMTEEEKKAKELEATKAKKVEDERLAEEKRLADEQKTLDEAKEAKRLEDEAVETKRLADEIEAKAINDEIEFKKSVTELLVVVKGLEKEINVLKEQVKTNTAAKAVEVIVPPVDEDEPLQKTKEQITEEIAKYLGLTEQK